MVDTSPKPSHQGEGEFGDMAVNNIETLKNGIDGNTRDVSGLTPHPNPLLKEREASEHLQIFF